MRGRIATVAVAVALVAGYGVADAVDTLPDGWPGVLTTREPWEEPAPFPTVSLDPAPRPPEVLADLSADAPVPDPQRLGALAEALGADPRIAAGFGAVVVDVSTGTVLLDVAGAEPRVPASTVKLLTTTAALTALGADTRLPTRVLAGPSVATDAAAAGAAAGTVHLVGGGDVLLARDEGDPDAVVGRAGLAHLAAGTAAALRERGVTNVRVALDDTLFTGDRTAPGWGPIDLEGGFVAPVSALAVDRGAVPGQIARDPDAALTAARVFTDALGSEGIGIEGDVVREAAPEGAPELAAVESATVAELVEHTLATSDNDVAEVLGRLVAAAVGAPADFAGATAAVLAEVAEQGLDLGRVTMVDASGLSEQSAVPPLVLARLVAAVADPARPDLLPVATGLPVAGLEGTLGTRFDGDRDPAAGVARAKTGTLVTVVALAGLVLDADGRLLAFAVIADAVPVGGVGPARDTVDAWVNALAACGCGDDAPAAEVTVSP
jgi:D-alanyl-D-alanine carboxypeptidase/D-alanyl-D-alanine-endopeptidase (penicillin-binding protein 4)